MTIQSYRDLEVWQKSRKLVTRVYKLMKIFPKDEVFGLASQLRRAAVSVPSNIAEGKSRRATQLFIACDLGYATEKKISLLLHDYAEVGRMLNGLITSLEKKLLPES